MSTGPSQPDSPIPAVCGKQLALVRDILLVIGVVAVVMNCAYLAKVESLVGEEVTTAVEKRLNDEERTKLVWDRTMLAVRMTTAGAVAVGALLVVFAFVVQRWPVPITVGSLVMYLGAAGARGYFDPGAPLPESPTLSIAVNVLAVVALIASSMVALTCRRAQHQSLPEAAATVACEAAKAPEA
jgi:hypothetical protein